MKIKLLMIIAILIVGYALSWCICTGLIYLISLCFSLKFSVITATGIWLILCLIKAFFNSNKTEKKK